MRSPTSICKCRAGARPAPPHAGSALVAALLITLIVTTALLAVGYRVGMDFRIGSAFRESQLSRLHAIAGSELAIHAVSQTDLWRGAVLDPWYTSTLDSTSISVTLTDPVDGKVPADGASGSSDADTVRVTTVATREDLSRTVAVDCVPLPHEALRFVAVGISDLSLYKSTIEGRVMGRDNISAGSVSLRGDVYADTESSVEATLDDADTDIIRRDTLPDLPTPDLQWFVDAGEEVNLPPDRELPNLILSSTYNRYGAVSPDAIYYIKGQNQDVVLTNCAIDACLVILKANTVYVRGASGGATEYRHRSPDPERLPALIVEGKLEMSIMGGTGSFMVLTSGFDLVPVTRDVTGVFIATELFRGPQIAGTGELEIDGAFLADDLRIVGGGRFRLRHDPRLNLTPLVELTGSGLRPLSGTAREVG